MNKTEFYKEQLIKAREVDGCDYTVEIKEISTGKEGVADAHDTDCNKVQVFYGAEDGSDDAIIPFEQFLKRFTIERVVHNYKGGWKCYKVADDSRLELEEEVKTKNYKVCITTTFVKYVDVEAVDEDAARDYVNNALLDSALDNAEIDTNIDICEEKEGA